MLQNKTLPTYLLMISYGRPNHVLGIIENYKSSIKPESFSKFLIIENTPSQQLHLTQEFLIKNDIYYEYISNSNKASLINFCFKNRIPEEEALVILIDNDILFKKDFILNYYNEAIDKGNKYYFGGALEVKVPNDIEEPLIPYLSISALGKSDNAFIKQKNPMFLGCNYCVFKSQWKYVNGLDERFSAGSKNGLGADESVFQKKLKYVGFKPFFVKNNEVQHLIDTELYKKENVLKRFKNNGFTHGFQTLITSQKFLKADYLKRLFYLFKRVLLLRFQGDYLDASFKYYYFLGFLKASYLYLKIGNKGSYLKGLINDSVIYLK